MTGQSPKTCQHTCVKHYLYGPMGGPGRYKHAVGWHHGRRKGSADEGLQEVQAGPLQAVRVTKTEIMVHGPGNKPSLPPAWHWIPLWPVGLLKRDRIVKPLFLLTLNTCTTHRSWKRRQPLVAMDLVSPRGCTETTRRSDGRVSGGGDKVIDIGFLHRKVAAEDLRCRKRRRVILSRKA